MDTDNSKLNKLRNRAATIAGAVIALLSAFGVVDWDFDASALMVAFAVSAVVFVATAYAHFRSGTTKEWAMLGASLVAVLGAGFPALNAIGLLSMSATEIGAVTGLVVAVFGLGAGKITRDRVTPVPKDYPFPVGGPINPNPVLENPDLAGLAPAPEVPDEPKE